MFTPVSAMRLLVVLELRVMPRLVLRVVNPVVASSVPPPRVMLAGVTLPGTAPRLASLLTFSVPPVIVVVPAYVLVALARVTLPLAMVSPPAPFTLPESTKFPVFVTVPRVRVFEPRLTLPERVSWVAFTALAVVVAPRVIGPANEFVPSKF